MRWRAPRIPKHSEWRTKTLFAWLPVRIGDQYVWLERYEVQQNYMAVHGWVTQHKYLIMIPAQSEEE